MTTNGSLLGLQFIMGCQLPLTITSFVSISVYASNNTLEVVQKRLGDNGSGFKNLVPNTLPLFLFQYMLAIIHLKSYRKDWEIMVVDSKI